MRTFFPILQPSPITEFNILHCSPILVALPITEFAPICAECDNVTSREDVIHMERWCYTIYRNGRCFLNDKSKSCPKNHSLKQPMYLDKAF